LIIIRAVRLNVVSGALTLVVLTLVAARAGDVTDRFSRLVPLGSATKIRLDATIGEVNITGSTRRDLLIEIVRRAPSAADLATFPAVVDATTDLVRVRALQANDGRDPNLKAEITIAAPAEAVFQAVRVFEGRVRLTNLKTACDVDLRRGPVEASGLAGRIRLESGIGSIEVKDSELTPGGMMRLRVFNGPLRVRFARPPANARILAVTFNGAITSDIALTKADRFGPRFGETTLGSGDPVMSLDVVKGDIAITVSRR
jgi:hypothetical protein